MERNVREFISCAARIVGKAESNVFELETLSDHPNLITSPIERILYCALKTLAKLNSLGDDLSSEGGGLIIEPQFSAGKYRADFYVIHKGLSWGKHERGTWSVVVECDSQKFHERTEEERRYEKRRDRFFTLLGHRTLHYTGSEIVQEPWLVAAEIFEAVEVCTKQILFALAAGYANEENCHAEN